ncbi:MAG: aliphatic sulfonate ABC transporter substrate-binding protein [Chlorobiaceae bacterium]|nr:aliphatic sulfonate ABC transporter substrate-binding protein [Chlorobiaceae bacterium]
MRRFISNTIFFVCTVLGLIVSVDVSASALPSQLNVDYAVYSPLSLVIKKFNWLEKEFENDDVHINWVFTPGSTVALKNLKNDSINFASTASLSSVWSRSGDNRIKSVYVVARAEWASLLVPRDSPISSVKELKGKRVGATLGTDHYFFLLRALKEVGLHKNDLEIVPLQQNEERTTREFNSVDAWSGLEPEVSMSQMKNGSRVIYRNILFNSFGVLNVTEAFADKYPDAVSRVIKVYERARRWVLKYPDDFEALYAEEAKLPLQVARVALNKYDFFNPVIDRNDMAMLRAASSVLKEEELINPDTDLDKVISDLVDRNFVLKQLTSGSVKP